MYFRWFLAMLLHTILICSPTSGVELNIRRDIDTVHLSWSTGAVTYALEITDSLSFSTNWTRYAGPAGIVGTENVVTNARNGSTRFYRLRADAPSGPMLANVSITDPLTFNGTGLLEFDYADYDCDIAALVVGQSNAISASTRAMGASFLGINSTHGRVSQEISARGLPFGETTFQLQLQDGSGRVSTNVSVKVRVMGAETNGTAPRITGFAPEHPTWRVPTGKYDRLKPRFTFNYSDSEGDIERVRMRIQPPSGPATISESSAVNYSIFGSTGQVLRSLMTFRPTNQVGTYRFELTLIDRNGHFGNSATASVNLVSSGVAQTPLSITSISPNGGAAGTAITINGTGFDVAGPQLNSVEINEVPLLVTNVTATSLRAIVPAQVGSGPIIVENKAGRTMSTNVFLIPKAVSLSPTASILAVGATLALEATVVSSTNRELSWSVDGIAGGDSTVGFVSSNGLFTAPSDIPVAASVTLRATLVSDTNCFGEAVVSISAPPATPGASLILASTGGNVRSVDLASGVEIRPDILASNTVISVRTLGAPEWPAAAPASVLGAAVFGPAGLIFDSPATITIPLRRHFSPGTTLPLRLYENGALVDEGIVATVSANGREGTAEVSHFSTYVVLTAVSLIFPGTPVSIGTISPSRAQEGMSVPVLLSGTGLSSDLLPEVLKDGMATSDILPAGYLGQETQAGVLLNVAPISSLGEGASATYTLQLKRGSSVVAETTFTVDGLDELHVLAGDNLEVNDIPLKRYSSIQIDGAVRVAMGLFDLESTGPVMINGSIDAKGEDGPSAGGRAGALPIRYGGRGGDGREDDAEPENYGKNARECIGFSAGDEEQGPCDPDRLGGTGSGSRTIPQGLGGIPGHKFDLIHDIEALAAYTASCIIGGGLACIPLARQVITTTDHVIDIVENGVTGKRGFGNVSPSELGDPAGGGGGGGGPILFTVPGLAALRLDPRVTILGGGGGAGGEAARAVRIFSASTITLNGAIDARGGNGGDASDIGDLLVEGPFGIDIRNVPGIPAMPGGGGGGGRGGVIALRSARQKVEPASEDQALTYPGKGGIGGVTIIDPLNGSWSVEMERASASDGRGSFRSLEGPFIFLEDGVTPLVNGLVERYLLRVRLGLRLATITVVGASGSRTFASFTGSDGYQHVTLVLFPGLNVIPGSSDLLNIHLVALGTDSDGDGLADSDEADLGTDPADADTDDDTLSDYEEVLAGTNPLQPDGDEDGLTDGREYRELGTSPFSPDSDGDQIWDGAEVMLGTDPKRANGYVEFCDSRVMARVRGQSGKDFLALFNPTNGQVGVLGTLNNGLSFGFAFNSTGLCYVARVDRLATAGDLLHPTGGALPASDVGSFGSPSGVPVEVVSLTWNPITTLLYGVQSGPGPGHEPTGQLVEIDPATGTATHRGSPGPLRLAGLAFTGMGALYAVQSDSASDRLVKLDPLSGGVLQDVGALGFSGVTALAYYTNGAFLASRTNGPAGSETLLVNAMTGVAHPLSTVPLHTIRGLAIKPIDLPCFEPPTQVSVLDISLAVAVSDVNLDGNPDILSGQDNGTAGTLNVLLGNGDGTFQSAIPFAVGRYPASLATGDFNGDGKPDVLTRDTDSATVSVLLGDGTGAFTDGPGSPYPHGVPGRFGSLVPGTFNGGAQLDFVVSGNQFLFGGLNVFTGDGAGGFSSPGGGFGPPMAGLAGADLNGDGSLDLAIAGDDRLLFTLNDGAGGFATFNTITNFDHGRMFGVAAGDLTGDSVPDIATSILIGENPGPLYPQKDSVYIFTNLSGGVFSQPRICPVARDLVQDHGPLTTVLADMNSDGALDIITMNVWFNTVSVLRGGGFAFAPTPGTPYNLRSNSSLGWNGGGEQFVAVGDFNRDGRPDLVTVVSDNPAGPVITLLLQKKSN